MSTEISNGTDNETSVLGNSQGWECTTADVAELNTNVKMLLPYAVGGSIIGKGGEGISSIQKETGCATKISKHGDTFPQSTERVAVITGKPTEILRVVSAFVDKYKDRTDLPLDPYDRKGVARCKEIKLVIPESSAGLIIGKGGETIKALNETTRCQIQVCSKDLINPAISERVVTIAFDTVEAGLKAAYCIIDKVSGDPKTNSAPFVSNSYLHITKSGGVSSALPSAMGSSASQAVITSSHHHHHHQTSPYVSKLFSASSDSSSVHPNLATSHVTLGMGGSQLSSLNTGWPNSDDGYEWRSPTLPPDVSQQQLSTSGGMGNLQVVLFLENMRNTLRINGYDETAIAEIHYAMRILAKHNVLGLGLGFGLSAITKASQNIPTTTSSLNSCIYDHLDSSAYAKLNSVSLDAFSSQPFSFSDPAKLPSVGVLEHGLPSDYYSRERDRSRSPHRRESTHMYMKEQKTSGDAIEFTVPENLIGAVLGKQGQMLAEIQRYSGAKVKVSRRDAAVENGSEQNPVNRVVTVEGAPIAVQAAIRRIEQVIEELVTRREKAKK